MHTHTKKRHRLAEWIQKRDTYICCLQETHFRSQDIYRLKIKGWKNIFHANGKQKKAGEAILISGKIDLKIKTITRDKEGHYKVIKRSIQKEDITIVNIYAPGHGIRPHHFMASRWGNSGNSVRLYFWGLQNHCSW